jgi:hypothetical protein
MNEQVKKDITLRTLAGDTIAVSKNLRPEPMHITVSIDAASERTELPTTDVPGKKNYSPTVKMLGGLFFLTALALVAYLLYRTFILQLTLF